MKVTELLKYYLTKKSDKLHVTPEVVKKFTSQPNFPWLISFPRTGSHWLRMIMELYFEKPSLTRVFYYFDATDYSCYHWHDSDLSVEGLNNVLYLYRDPVETIYSTLQYHKEDISDSRRIIYWSEVYGQHLKKWLIDESFTKNKTVIRYEGLKQNIHQEFAKICAHFCMPFDSARLDNVLQKISKESLKEKTQHDNQVVNLSKSYGEKRAEFAEQHAELIMNTVFKQTDNLRRYFTSARTAH